MNTVTIREFASAAVHKLRNAGAVLLLASANDERRTAAVLPQLQLEIGGPTLLDLG